MGCFLRLAIRAILDQEFNRQLLASLAIDGDGATDASGPKQASFDHQQPDNIIFKHGTGQPSAYPRPGIQADSVSADVDRRR